MNLKRISGLQESRGMRKNWGEERAEKNRGEERAEKNRSGNKPKIFGKSAGDKVLWKPGNMLYPVPAVMVSCKRPGEKPNIITIAWAGTVCSDPPMLSISVRKERYSYGIIKETGEFVVNLVTPELARAADFCGVKSGKDRDKFKEARLTPQILEGCPVPGIGESPVNIWCKTEQVISLGSHDLFLARVQGVFVDSACLDDKGKLHLNDAGLIAYSHGEYFRLGKKAGTFGYSVKKEAPGRKRS